MGGYLLHPCGQESAVIVSSQMLGRWRSRSGFSGLAPLAAALEPFAGAPETDQAGDEGDEEYLPDHPAGIRVTVLTIGTINASSSQAQLSG